MLRNGLNKTNKRVVLLKFIVETTLSYEPRDGVVAGGGVCCVNEINEFICYSKRKGVMVSCHFGSKK